MSRKTIIIFNPDEMRADAVGHLPLSWKAAVTPNLDALVASEAVSFSNAYCRNSTCVPSRCSFLTGVYPHTTGHRTMGYLMRPGEDSLFAELKRAGYYVWMNDRNDIFAGQYDGWAESNADEIYYSGQTRPAPGSVNPDIRGLPGSKYYYSFYHGELALDISGKNYSRDDEAVDAAIERIKNPVDERPLCIFLDLHNPHVPYQIEEPFYSAIDSSMVELVDFYATVMDYAGLTPSHSHYGRSLRPVIEGSSESVRTYPFSEGRRNEGECHCDEFHTMGQEGTSPSNVHWPKQKVYTDDSCHTKGIMIRSADYKYISRLKDTVPEDARTELQHRINRGGSFMALLEFCRRYR